MRARQTDQKEIRRVKLSETQELQDIPYFQNSRELAKVKSIGAERKGGKDEC